MTTKLELTWPGKNDPTLSPEPRILIENPELSNVSLDSDTSNMLIHGDNLMALKALERDFAGKVKCIYIDPPYNTGAAFEHYDDNFEHSTWLGLMKPRLELLRKLLAEDGFIFVQIDDNEMAYLKVLLDEIFGRQNYVNTVVWKRRGGSANPSNRLNNVTDYILWYSKGNNYIIFPAYSRNDENTQLYINERFKNELNGRRYMLAPVERNAKLGMRETMRYEYKGYIPKFGWMMSKDNLEKLDKSDRLHWNSKGRPNRRVFLDDYKGQPINNLWTDIFVINPMSGERVDFDGGQKPEALIQRVFELATQPGDLVLDSFLGSGTTAAVAHKMGRRYIGIEIGDHAYTHCKTRLDKVIAGEDQGGITRPVNWTGGGGYRFYELAPTLINTDEYGQATINPAYDGVKLAKAIALHEGFTYDPDETFFWKQSKGSEKSYLYVTTNFVSREAVEAIHSTMEDNEYLIIACPACDSGIKMPNIIVKKIPQAILGRCEFGKNDYNLNVSTPPDTVDDVDNVDNWDEWEEDILEDFEQFEETDETTEKYLPNGNKQLSQLSLDFNEERTQ